MVAECRGVYGSMDFRTIILSPNWRHVFVPILIAKDSHVQSAHRGDLRVVKVVPDITRTKYEKESHRQ
jgi:hypothetical protein